MASPTAPDTRPFTRRLVEDLRALAGSRRELWLVFGVKFLESVAYFAITNLLVVYLSEDLGYGDQEAGSLYGSWATLISVMTFVSGMVADALGVRRAMIVSVVSSLVGRGLFAVAESRGLALTGLVVSSWGTAALLPTMIAGVKRYTTKETSSFGFSFFYVVMNLGAFVAPLTISVFRRLFRSSWELDLPVFGHVSWSSSQLVFLVGTAATAGALVLTLLMEDEAAVEAAEKKPGLPLDVLKDKAFWRFMLFVSLLVLVRLIFQHAHQTWPKYTLREFGKDFDFAGLWSLNPLMIILLTPFATAFTRDLSAFRSIVVGSVITALSVFFMVASTTVPASVAFIVVLSIGEMIWSPRLYEYTATIAPKGREASYMGLSAMPMFFAKMAVGWMSGTMLATWCPEIGERHSHIMWAVIGATTLAGPLLILALRRVIEGAKPAAQAPATQPAA